jgi:hypothetical protein
MIRAWFMMILGSIIILGVRVAEFMMIRAWFVTK